MPWPSSVKSGLPELESIVLFVCEWGCYCSFSMGEVGGSFEPYVSFFNRLDFFLPVWMAFFRVRCFFFLVVVAVAVVPVVFSFHWGVCIIGG